MKVILKNKKILMICFLSFVLNVGYILTLDNTTIDPFDATGYDILAKNIINGQGLQRENLFAKTWFSFRPPGYPVFLAIVYTVLTS